MEPDSGVYVIRHIESGKVYVGSSAMIKRRWSLHRSLLRRSAHHSPHLQRAWDKHGADAFVFEVVELCGPEALAEAETRHIAVAHAFDPARGYNSAPVGGSLLGLVRGPQSPEHREKIGAAQRGKTVSDYARQRSSEVHRGKTISAEHRAAVAKAAAERVHTAETRAKLSAAATAISDETRQKRSESCRAAMTEERRKEYAERGRNISEETRQKRAESVRRSWEIRRRDRNHPA